jgi:hypothetical protein
MRLNYKKHAVMALVVWGGSAIVLGSAYLFIVSPRTANCMAVRIELSAKEKDYKFAEQACLNRNAVDEQLEQLRKELNVYVAEAEQAANLTFEIARLAKEGKISAPSVKDRDKGDTSLIGDSKLICEEGYSVNFSSEFPQFSKMVHALESHQPVLFVKKFSILPPNGTETMKDVRLDISVLARRQDG